MKGPGPSQLFVCKLQGEWKSSIRPVWPVCSFQKLQGAESGLPGEGARLVVLPCLADCFIWLLEMVGDRPSTL